MDLSPCGGGECLWTKVIVHNRTGGGGGGGSIEICVGSSNEAAKFKWCPIVGETAAARDAFVD